MAEPRVPTNSAPAALLQRLAKKICRSQQAQEVVNASAVDSSNERCSRELSPDARYFRANGTDTCNESGEEHEGDLRSNCSTDCPPDSPPPELSHFEENHEDRLPSIGSE